MQDLLDLSERVALITGAGSGIGRCAARLFAQHGCKVILVDRSLPKVDEAASEIRDHGGEAETLEVDVSNPQQVKHACDFAIERFGRLDIAYANAGVNGVWAPIEEISDEEFDQTIAVNLKGTFLTMKYATPHLKRQGGSILVTSSVNGTRNFSCTGAVAYSTSKAGQAAMAKMMAVELGQFKIRVNVICPGAISTNIGESTNERNLDKVRIPASYPKGASPLTGSYPGEADQVAKLALFLVSDMADHITGEVVYIDGGSSLVIG